MPWREHYAPAGLVERILPAKRVSPAAETSAFGRELDERVYRLYGEGRDEIKLVEGAGQSRPEQEGRR